MRGPIKDYSSLCHSSARQLSTTLKVSYQASGNKTFPDFRCQQVTSLTSASKYACKKQGKRTKRRRRRGEQLETRPPDFTIHEQRNLISFIKDNYPLLTALVNKYQISLTERETLDLDKVTRTFQHNEINLERF